MSVVGYSTNSELELYPTTLIQNSHCIWQYWFGISAVSDSADLQIFTFKYEYLSEFENILGCESGAHMGSIHEKNQR